MRFSHLEYFICAVKCHSMNRAARQLDISPQALWAGVAALEKKLGYPLLERSASGVSPTQKGEIVFNEAIQFFDIVKKWYALNEVAEEKNQVTVNCGASTTLMRWLVPQVILKVKKIAPYIHLKLYESFVEEVFRTALDKRMLGIITCVNPRVENLYHIQLAQNNMTYDVGPEDSCVVVINRDHPYAALDCLTTQLLSELSLVWNPRRDRHFVYRDISKYFAPSALLYIPEQENLLRLISMELNFTAVLPRSALLAVDEWNKRLIGMEVEDFPMRGNIWLVYPRRLNGAEKIVLDSFRRVMAEIQC